MHIYFSRHGESQANLLHEISNRGLRHGLTPRGREQAGQLAQRLQGLLVRRIYSSPILRAVETSQILSGRLGVEVEVTEALREFDCGVMEGRSDEGAWSAWREVMEAWLLGGEWERRIEGGESFLDIRRRFEPFIDGLVRQYGNTPANVVCMGHGGLYWLMLPVVLKNVGAGWFSQYGFDYTACVVAEWRPGGLVCVDWNGHDVEARLS